MFGVEMVTIVPILVIGFCCVITIASFALMLIDKHRARHRSQADRIPEGLIFFMAIVFGGIGVYLGMILLRHKTRTWYFQIGIPLLIAQNVAALYVLLTLFL
jgi:uncharacterized membrane protein YsdA (DUF1294 family)